MSFADCFQTKFAWIKHAHACLFNAFECECQQACEVCAIHIMLTWAYDFLDDNDFLALIHYREAMEGAKRTINAKCSDGLTYNFEFVIHDLLHVVDNLISDTRVNEANKAKLINEMEANKARKERKEAEDIVVMLATV